MTVVDSGNAQPVRPTDSESLSSRRWRYVARWCYRGAINDMALAKRSVSGMWDVGKSWAMVCRKANFYADSQVEYGERKSYAIECCVCNLDLRRCRFWVDGQKSDGTLWGLFGPFFFFLPITALEKVDARVRPPIN